MEEKDRVISGKAIREVSGTGVAVRGDNVDTDRIYPARFLLFTTFSGIGKYALYDERLDAQGREKPHPFNDARFSGAGILAVNANFGCGSSREHAAQALMRMGIRAIIGESFGDIFARNCARLGVPTLCAGREQIAELMDFMEANPSGSIAISLEEGKASFGGRQLALAQPEDEKKAFLEGSWDSASMLLGAGELIAKTAGGLAYLKLRKKPA